MFKEVVQHGRTERDCGDCNLCCKLPRTDFKEEYQWCKSCDVGNGCKIYSTRPQVCKDFKCLWKLGMCEERLKPNKVGFYIVPEREESWEDAVFTIYAETHRVDNIPKVMGDIRLVDHTGRTWIYVIRYNPNEDDLAIYDKDRFGNKLKYVKRGDIL